MASDPIRPLARGSETRARAADPPETSTAVSRRVLGGGLLRWLERGFLYFDRLLPEAANPFLQTGAIALTSLIVATVTGVLLLFWYSPSVEHAYPSVAAMSASRWNLSGILRALHRYSSDAAMLFAAIHVLRLLFERRVTGARWLPWVTGICALFLLWLVGWTGYWLIWDAAAKHVATGTARLLDVLPIFVDPMGRSFLTDEGVHSLLFFAVFFAHMLIPLGIGVALWLHLLRTARPSILTRRAVTLWGLASLVALCVVYPPELAEPARMSVEGERFGMDWWYLAPLLLSDRLDGWTLWGLLVAGAAISTSVPWWLRRAPERPASVDTSRCNACMQCFEDCPFEAISMVPRSDGREQRFAAEASVDPKLCVGCGICAGSCDSLGVGLDWLPVQQWRRRVDRWLDEAAEGGESVSLAVLCAESAGAGFAVDAETGLCADLPGYRVIQVPCAGWIHPLSLERGLRRGADFALVVTCGPGACHFREGQKWLGERLDGLRKPLLRTERVDRDRIVVLALDRSQHRELLQAARELKKPEARSANGNGEPPPRLDRLRAAVSTLVLLGLIAIVSQLGYAAPGIDGSELVVSFKHPGVVSENCRELSAEELASRPVHMRKARVCDRRRAPVRLRVSIDGARVFDGSYPPAGLWGDLNSIAVESIPIEPGEHRIRIAIGDTLDPDEWSHTAEESLLFENATRRVLSFDRLAGFSWH